MTTDTDVALACPSCSAPVVAGDLFCEACGHELPPTGVPCPACDAFQIVDGYCASCGLRQPAPRDHVELALAGVGVVTDKGHRHHHNEDSFAVAVADGVVLGVVCDGVSMSTRSDEASQAAVEAALAVLIRSGADGDLEVAFDAAQAAVLHVPVEPHPEKGPPSCTFLAGVITDAAVRLAMLGDCRSYWVGADGDARQLTEDESWAAVEMRAGRLTAEAARTHPMAGTITRWLAIDADPGWRPTLVDFTPPGPGHLLLVSDGLWAYTEAPADLVAAMGKRTDDPLAIAQRLVAHALAGGGHDNITVLISVLPLVATGPGAPPVVASGATPAPPSAPVPDPAPPPPPDPAPEPGDPAP
jgi:serine/threonine protein phosphatase PrpC